MVKYFALMNVMRSTLLFSNQKMPLIMMNIHFFFFTFFSFLSQFVYTVRRKLSLKFLLVTPSHAGKLNTNTWINRK